MSDTTHEAHGRIVPSCVEELESYQQADMDGIMVLASRQAIHETIDAYWARVETCGELEAKLAKAVEAAEAADRLAKTMTEYSKYTDWFPQKAYDDLTKYHATLAELKGETDENEI